jgi:hypothetical protein
LALAHGHHGHQAFEALRLARGAGGFGIAEDELFELMRALTAHVFVKRHSVSPLPSIIGEGRRMTKAECGLGRKTRKRHGLLPMPLAWLLLALA